MRQEIMTVDEWAAVEDNPIQRDTERHARFAKTRHLAHAAEPQKIVSAAYVKNRGLVKIDGHTRSLLWSKGELERPDHLFVTIYNVDSMNEAVELYRMFDSQDAVETAPDKIFGAYRLHRIEPHSALLQKGGLMTAFRIIQGTTLRGGEIYRWVGSFRAELLAIDDRQLNYDRFMAGILAAAIIGTRKHGEWSLDFFESFSNDDGSSYSGKRDAVETFSQMVKLRRAKHQTSGHRNQEEIAALALDALERYVKGSHVPKTLKPVDLRSYINLVLYNVKGNRTRSTKDMQDAGGAHNSAH